MGRYEKLGKNILFMTIGNFASKILSFLFIPFYTAILTTKEYGIADLMTTTVSLIMPLLTLQISSALLRFPLDKEKDTKKVFTTGMFVVIIGLITFLIFSPLMLLYDGLRDYYWYFIAYYAIVVCHEMVCNFARGIEKIVTFSLSGVIHTITYLVLNIFFLLVMNWGIKGYLLAMILGNVASTVYICIDAKLHRYVGRSLFDKRLLGEMLHYSIPLITSSLSWWVSNSSDKYMLTIFCGVAATGVYSVSQRIPSLFATITSIFMTGWINSAVEDFGSEDSKKFFSNIYRKYSAINIIAVSGVVFLAKPLARILFSNDFFSGWYYVPILVFAALFNSGFTFLESIYTSEKKTKMLFISSMILALSNIVLNSIFIFVMGAIGAAIATLISYVAVWIIRMVDSRKIMKLEWNIKNNVLSYLLISGQIILVMADIKNISFIGAGVICLVIALINLREIKDVVVYLISRLKRTIDVA